MAPIRCIKTLLAVLFLAFAGGASAQMAEPSGVWTVANGHARVRIGPCGEAYWGVIDWARNPNVDKNNPDPAKRARPVVGMPILLAMKPAGPNEWKGEIYNAENGKTYDGKMSVAGPDALKISGCVFGGLFCGGQTWERFKEEGTASIAPSKPATATLPTKPAPTASKTNGAVTKPAAAGAANKSAATSGGKNGSANRVEGEVCPDQPG
jgi:uncharacterized protein (DUF2147 family)